MELQQIRYFLAVARSMNFTRAADECNVTQPALSKAVKKLEDELGGPLFFRERANTNLTDLGRLMLPHLERTYNAAESARSEARGYRKGEIAQLRIGLIWSAPVTILLDALNEVARTFPGLLLDFERGSVASIVDRLVEGALDAGVVTDGTVGSNRIDRWPLFRERLAVACPPGHALASEDSVPFGALARHAVVEPVDQDAAEVVKLLEEATGVALNVRHRAALPDLPGLVASGLGLAVVPSGAAQRFGSAVVRPIADEAGTFGICLAAVCGRPYSPALGAFIRLMRVRSQSGRLAASAAQ